MVIKAKKEFEIITHNTANFRVFLVNLLYRTPHSHRDFEIGLVLDGRVDLFTSGMSYQLKKGDIYVLNPYQTHELLASGPTLILSLQIPPAFFQVYYPKIVYLSFSDTKLEPADEALVQMLRSCIVNIAKEFFRKEDLFEFRCANLICTLFYSLLSHTDHLFHSQQEQKAVRNKGNRVRRIMHYIDEHYTERIFLKDIAKELDLDLYYLSHFFKENFGTGFQSYVNRLRCEHARHLLLTTDFSLLDISINSGFSDPKYFNKGFRELYGCLPKQYRKNFRTPAPPDHRKSMPSTEEFISADAGIDILNRYT